MWRQSLIPTMKRFTPRRRKPKDFKTFALTDLPYRTLDLVARKSDIPCAAKKVGWRGGSLEWWMSTLVPSQRWLLPRSAWQRLTMIADVLTSLVECRLCMWTLPCTSCICCARDSQLRCINVSAEGTVERDQMLTPSSVA